MALKIVQTQRESSFKGSMWTQSEPDIREIHLAHRESRSFRWSSPLGSSGREKSSRTNKQMS
jgi:hypothetical protein